MAGKAVPTRQWKDTTMGNDYMPMVDEICVEAARSYVNQMSEDHNHEWLYGDDVATDEQAFRYIINVLDEAREDYAEDGPDMSYDGGYAGKMLHALAFAVATLMENDWSTSDTSKWDVRLHP